ncbi:CUB domain [Trinorchestia longiramus]|nr:CUB domain [Trinorchestia longiramus]
MMLFTALCGVLVLNKACAVRTVVHGDVCQSFSGRKVYLEPFTGALLYATNISSHTFKRIPRDVDGVLLGTSPSSSSIVYRRRPRNLPNIDFSDSILWKDVGELNLPSIQSYDLPRTPGSQIFHRNNNKKELQGNIQSEGAGNSLDNLNSRREQQILRYMNSAPSNFRTLSFLSLSGQMDDKTQNALQDFSEDAGRSKIQLRHVPKENLTDLKLNLDSSPAKLPMLVTNDQLPFSTLPRTELYNSAHQELHHPPVQDGQDIVLGLPLNIHRRSRSSSKDNIRPSSETSVPDRPSVDQLPKPDFQQCGLDIYTCAGCHLHFEFQELHLPSCSTDEVCRCDYIRLREPPYLNAEDGRDICGNFEQSNLSTKKAQEYTTFTREASLYFLYRNVFTKAFSLRVSALRNSFVISRDTSPSTDVLRSPFFPELYPKDYWVEYIFTGINQTSRVQITFEDFAISPWSFIEVHDNQRVHVAAFNGNVFRPQLLVSTGSRLTLKFAANGDTGRGFKLRYIFSDIHELLPPYRSDCGGFVTNFGGTITMMNMTRGLGNRRVVGEVPYDCIWLIKPPQEYGLKSHLSIRVVNFDYMGSNSNVEIRKGLTSDDDLLEELTSTPASEHTTEGKEYIVPFASGFYVRLRGMFGEKSHLAIVYASFNYEGGCYPLTDLKCHNKRCIPKMLRCDGFDHCGDNSDEPPSCYSAAVNRGEANSGEDEAWWYKPTPNYYFPYRSPLFGEQQGSGILLLSSLFVLILVIMGLISFMIRQGAATSTSRQTRGHRRHRRHSLNDGVEIFDASADDPPLYEAPPDYEDVVKFILSGNNLKLVRRPGGMTAWVTNIDDSTSSTSAEPSALSGQTTDLLTPIEREGSVPRHNALNLTQLAPLPLISHSPIGRAQDERKSRRTRHASLDLEERGDVVIWDPNQRPNKGGSGGFREQRESPSQYRYHPSTPPHLPSALRRTSMQSPDTSSHADVSSQIGQIVLESKEVSNNEVAGSSEASGSVTETGTPNFHMNAEEGPGQPLSPSSSVDPLCPSQDDEACDDVLKPNQKGMRKSKKFKKGKRKKSKSTALAVESKDIKPPSYDLVLQQVLDEFYITDEAFVIDDLKNNIAAQLRVRVAREKFQQLCASTNESTDEIYTKTRKENDGENSRKNTISPGTVKRRKARLLNEKQFVKLEKIATEENSAFWLPEKSESLFAFDTDNDAKFLGKMTKCTFRKNRKASFSRNKSTPSLGNIISRDLEIYFSQKTPSPTGDPEEQFAGTANDLHFISNQSTGCLTHFNPSKLVSFMCEPPQQIMAQAIFNSEEDCEETTSCMEKTEARVNFYGNNSSGCLIPRTEVSSVDSFKLPKEKESNDFSFVKQYSPTSPYSQLSVYPPFLVGESIPQNEHASELEADVKNEPVPEFLPDFPETTNETEVKFDGLTTNTAATGAIPKRRSMTRANTAEVVGASDQGVEV